MKQCYLGSSSLLSLNHSSYTFNYEKEVVSPTKCLQIGDSNLGPLDLSQMLLPRPQRPTIDCKTSFQTNFMMQRSLLVVANKMKYSFIPGIIGKLI